MQDLIRQALAQAMTYPAYRDHLTRLLTEEGRTTGDNQSDFYLEIAALNEARMDRLDRKVRLTADTEARLATLTRPLTLLVLTEGWCGDAAQILPVLNWLAEASAHIELRCVLRDEHPALMDEFLTAGTRSIPKVIVLDPATHDVLADWGPRPAPAQRMVMAYKNTPTDQRPPYPEFQKALHTWYARDKTRTTQEELVEVVSGK